MNRVMRTTAILPSIASMLAAAPAFSADPLGSAPAPLASTPVSPADEVPPKTVPAATVAVPTPGSSESGVPASSAGQAQAKTPPLTSPPSPNALPAASPKSAETAPKEKSEVPETVFNPHVDYAIGGFGGIGIMYARLAGHDIVQVCGEGGVILGHALTLGAGGCGTTPRVEAEQYGPAPHYPDDRMTLSYGGAIIRYHFFSRRVINLGIGALIGGGRLKIGVWDRSSDEGPDNYTHGRSDGVFVVEPQIGGFANITRWLRVGVTAGYRITAGVNMDGLSASDLSSPTLGGVVQAGWF